MSSASLAMKLAVLALALAIGAYVAWRAGSPWTKGQCVREASALKTTIGVRAALEQCARQFGPLTSP